MFALSGTRERGAYQCLFLLRYPSSLRPRFWPRRPRPQPPAPPLPPAPPRPPSRPVGPNFVQPPLLLGRGRYCTPRHWMRSNSKMWFQSALDDVASNALLLNFRLTSLRCQRQRAAGEQSTLPARSRVWSLGFPRGLGFKPDKTDTRQVTVG